MLNISSTKSPDSYKSSHNKQHRPMYLLAKLQRFMGQAAKSVKL